MSELLENMILLCGEPELDGLNDPAACLRALIDGLITQRNRADAAEAEIARLKEREKDLVYCLESSNEEWDKHCADLTTRIFQLTKKLDAATQPPAVGEDVIRIRVAPRPDGGVRIWSDDLKGLVLSGSNRDLVFGDLGSAIKELIRTKDAK